MTSVLIINLHLLLKTAEITHSPTHTYTQTNTKFNFYSNIMYYNKLIKIRLFIFFKFVKRINAFKIL